MTICFELIEICEKDAGIAVFIFGSTYGYLLMYPLHHINVW
jgi:hypothetical protein